MPGPGELLSLLTALTWAIAVILFKKCGETVHPAALNLFKNSVAFLLFLPTAMLLGGPLLPDQPLENYVLMVVAGAIGVAVADTMFLHSLNLLGASLTAVVDCLYSPSIILLSVLFLGESMAPLQFAGAGLIVAAVASPLFEKKEESRGHLDRSRVIRGTLWGAGSMIAMAVSIVAVKPILDKAPLLWSCQLRMLGGVLGLVVMLAFYPKRRQVLASLNGKGLKFAIASALVGGYLSMLLWLAGMKFTEASVSAALNQTSNVFLFVLAAVVLKELVTAQRIAGIAMGVVGAFLVMFG